jgi:hypothetical protein
MASAKKSPKQSSEKERDQGYDESHGYGAGHGGPSGPGDAPAPLDAPIEHLPAGEDDEKDP